MKIKPLCEMYNTHYRIHCNPGVVVDVPDELARLYIKSGAAVAVDDQAEAEPKKPRGKAKKEQ